MPTTLSQRIDTAYRWLRAQTDAAPEVGLILGSGLGDFCDKLENPLSIPFSSIPGFPVSTVEGHAGAFVFGRCRGRAVAALRGRDVGVPYRPSLPTPAGAARDGFVRTMTAAGLL